MTTSELPEGDYPFASASFPLSEMAMMEAPADLEQLLRKAAVDNGVRIIQDEPVELVCRAEGYPDTTFLAWQPSGGGPLHILAPKEFVRGRA